MTSKLQSIIEAHLPEQGIQWQQEGLGNNTGYTEGFNSCLSDIKSRIPVIEKEIVELFAEKECGQLCTNGVDTYHEWNTRHSGTCYHCEKLSKKLTTPKTPDIAD